MNKDLDYIFEFLKNQLESRALIFQLTGDGVNKLEAKGTLPAMQGKQKVDGFYFATLMMKPKDVRFYFFPVYTHADELKDKLSPKLQKFLKGKSCFHIKYLDEDLEKEIEKLFQESIALYRENNWLAS